MSQFYMSSSGGSSPTSSGSLVLIDTKTPSGASSITFTTGITNTYDHYYLRFKGVQGSGTILVLQLSTDGGGTWITTNYDLSLTYSNSGVTTGSYVSLNNGLTLLNNMTTTAGASHSGNMHMFSLTANQYMPCSISKSKCTGNVFMADTSMSCYKIGPLVVNALKILPDSGTFSGTFKTVWSDTMSQFYIGGGSSGTPVTDNFMVLVNQATVSGAADVQFTTGITPTYDNYYLIFYGVTSTAPSTLYLQISTNGGGTWIATNYDGNTVFCHSLSQSGVYQGLLPGFQLAGNLTTTATAQSAGYANLFRLTSNTFMPGIIALSKCTGNIYDGETYFGCNYTGAMVVNAIRIVPDAGNLSGTFKLYGIVQ